MASWFNPRAVTYNANPYLVAQSGAIGDTLYKLYTDARANKQEQDRQNELKRQFEANFAENQRQFNENQKFKEREYQDSQNKIKFDNNLNLQKYYLEQQKFKESKRQFNTDLAYKRDKDLGVDLGIKFKQIPQSSQKQISNSINLLNALSGGLSTINKNGGIDKLSGVWDKSVLTVAPSWSQTSSDYNAVVKNIADTYAENQKGNGKYNITNVTDVLTPGMFGNENVRSNMKTISEQTINELSALVKNLKSQGYNTDEVEQQLNSFTKLLTKDNIDKFLNGKYTDPEDEKTLSNSQQPPVSQTPTQPLKNQEVLNINNIDLNAIEAELRRRGL